MMHLDKDFVHYWSERYEVEELGPSTVERELLTVTHAAIAERGFLTADELKAIARWKSQRALGVLETDGDTIKDVTHVAFAPDTPGWMRHHILRLLSGVRHPMASAILTVWNPETQSIFDIRVVQVHARRALAWALPADFDRGYWNYMKTYQQIAEGLQVSYRSLDRALWKWNKAGMPRTWSKDLDLPPDQAAFARAGAGLSGGSDPGGGARPRRNPAAREVAYEAQAARCLVFPLTTGFLALDFPVTCSRHVAGAGVAVLAYRQGISPLLP